MHASVGLFVHTKSLYKLGPILFQIPIRGCTAYHYIGKQILRNTLKYSIVTLNIIHYRETATISTTISHKNRLASTNILSVCGIFLFGVVYSSFTFDKQIDTERSAGPFHSPTFFAKHWLQWRNYTAPLHPSPLPALLWGLIFVPSKHNKLSLKFENTWVKERESERCERACVCVKAVKY